MAEIKTVGIKELKNNLSAYLREVRRGTTILVADRNRVVAELGEPRTGYAAQGPVDPRLAGWIAAGEVIAPTATKQALPESPVHAADGTAARLLDADRGEAGG